MLAAREKGKIGTEAKVRTTQTSNLPLTARGLEYAGREERKTGLEAEKGDWTSLYLNFSSAKLLLTSGSSPNLFETDSFVPG